MKLLETYKNQSPLIRFIINGILLISLWFIFYNFFRYTSFISPIYEFTTQQLTTLVLFLSEKILDTINLETTVTGTIIHIEGAKQSVNLLRGCLGRNLMGIFAGFILAFPGNWKMKLWYIPLGIFSIIIINIFRIIGLAYNSYCCPDNMQFNHDTFFNYSIYALTFVLWMVFVRYFSAFKKKTVQKQ
ncbi:MAG: archaeosortase/exosortase family protein [Bacteroidales bacterium]|nr:archaeosortase/exosortase family protein [Bacteroidales bacterium]